MKVFTGTHKTRCMICGGKDDIAMKCGEKHLIDICESCISVGAGYADKSTMLFMVNYVTAIRKINPGCYNGSEFTNDCISKFEDVVWQGFLRDWIKRNRKVY